ncbi:MAG: hypothetical protein F4X64_14930 [Chloroflexi bacterium]|nr:hypothetical protein [Chloroflexota bacterium]
MATETTPTPKTTGELTLAELLTLLRETVTEALGGIVGYPDEKPEPCQDAVAAAEPEAVPNGFQRVGTGSRVQIVLDEAGKAAVAANMARKVRDLEVDELEWWVYYIVDEVGEELIGDPDEGLEFKEEFAAGLEQSIAEAAAGNTIPAEEVYRRLGLD